MTFADSIYLNSHELKEIDDEIERSKNKSNKGPTLQVIGINRQGFTNMNNTSENENRKQEDDSVSENTQEDIKFFVKWSNKGYYSSFWLDLENQKQDFVDMAKYVTNNYEKFYRKKKFVPFNFVDNLYIPFNSTLCQENFEPECIIYKEFINKKQFLYLTKWKKLDIEESTFEEPTVLPQKLIDLFENDDFSVPMKLNIRKISYARNPQEIPKYDESPNFKNNNKLTNYQVEGLNWLLFCFNNNRNAILADEMGLGKTIQGLAMLEMLHRNYHIDGPFLIVCPLSTLPNWLNEIELWTDFKVISLIGSEKSRNFLLKYAFYQQDKKTGKVDFTKIRYNIVLTSYEQLGLNLKIIKNFYFAYMIIDEGHRLKSRESQTVKNFEQVLSHQILLMTGTPIQNNVSELWSLLHFLAPLEFDDLDGFMEDYDNITDPETVDQLQNLIRPFILRRKKVDVELSLLPKEETIIEVELTQIQRTFYRSIIDDNRDLLLENITQAKISFLNIMMQLRKICNHPYLFPSFENMCIENYKTQHNIPINEPITRELEYQILVNSCGKTILLDKLLPKLKSDNHKVLLFSQMTKMLDIIEDCLAYRGYKYERLDGSTAVEQRSESMRRFAEEEDNFIFLLSTHAGGLGLNLTAADTVIIYDSDWNPQNDLQAMARCHRIGQKKEVKIYRLITRATYEAEMFTRASKKLALDFALLDTDPQSISKSNSSEDAKELEMILRKGAYYIFNEECDELDKFCSENIETILKHRSKKTTRDFVSGGNSLFAKVKFDGGAEAQVDFGDKDFWTNILPKGNVSNTEIRRRLHKKRNYGDYETESFEQTKKSKKKTKNDEVKKKDKEKKEKKKKKEADTSGEYVPEQDADSQQLDDEEEELGDFTIEDNLIDDDKTKKRNFTFPFDSNNNNQSLLGKMSKKKVNSHPTTKVNHLLVQSNKGIPHNFDESDINGIINAGMKYGCKGVTSHFPEGYQKFCVRAVLSTALEIYKQNYILQHNESPEDEKFQKYSKYIDTIFKEVIGQRIMENIMKDPIISNLAKMKTLFNGKEETILENSMKYDRVFTILVYLSEHVDLIDSEFAQSMQPPPTWRIVDDYYLLWYLVSYGIDSISMIFLNPSTPYHKDLIPSLPSTKWLDDRVILLMNEIEIRIPKGYSTRSKRLIGPAEFESRVCLKAIPKYRINQILRALYFYGFPQESLSTSVYNTIKKIAYLHNTNYFKSLKNQPKNVNTNMYHETLIYRCIAQIFGRMVKYDSYFQQLIKPTSFCIDYANLVVDISFVPDELFEALAKNIIMLRNIRSQLNVSEQQLIDIPRWKIAPTFWTSHHDLIMFQTTQKFGFLSFASLMEAIGSGNITYQYNIYRSMEVRQIAPIFISQVSKTYNFIRNLKYWTERVKEIMNFIINKKPLLISNLIVTPNHSTQSNVTTHKITSNLNRKQTGSSINYVNNTKSIIDNNTQNKSQNIIRNNIFNPANLSNNLQTIQRIFQNTMGINNPNNVLINPLQNKALILNNKPNYVQSIAASASQNNSPQQVAPNSMKQFYQGSNNSTKFKDNSPEFPIFIDSSSSDNESISEPVSSAQGNNTGEKDDITIFTPTVRIHNL
ncbi:hypothetical protein TRFO_31454 [Tritrichomonas foetus]|uniref:SNF2 family N-terminal domain containing protein n=1 Tax=Tritrichomonas foetus TaxID=1144522 RepID=A0A1J4JVV9_9EUKA|nr:hypothetical protein TRFO_31454 [Tritrichomonas foetus]|eukprot:OHT01668.1 hypothetical protein TRFO_31454 [Tritrichomonas foetus]